MEPCNILAVDDEVHNLEIIERLLTWENGLKLYRTTNPFEALEMVQSLPIQIIITDQRMPEMTGIELLNQVIDLSPDTVRIILTAYTEVPEILDAINLGHVYGYITKPWNPEELRTMIQRARSHYNLITENRALASELQIKNELLEKKNKDLEKFNDLKNQFMLVASHELRTPATIITGSLEILASQKNSLNLSQFKIVQNALNGALRLNEIIETFFETIKFNSEVSVLHPTTINLGELISLVEDRFGPYLNTRKLMLISNVDDHLMVMGDQRKLYLVFENIISNAIKYTPDGGHIEVRGFTEEDQAHIIVKDSGIGIPAEELEKIFDTFYQLENVKYHHTSRHEFMGGGTGLGLSLCKSIIQAHHGKIWAESDGKATGSTFFVTLPLSNGKYELRPPEFSRLNES